MKRINYKTLYLDFFRDSELLPKSIKQQLIKKLEEDQILSFRTLIHLNTIITENTLQPCNKDSACLKSYDRTFIKDVLDFQKKNELSNVEIALRFKLSRNTVSRWRKIF